MGSRGVAWLVALAGFMVWVALRRSMRSRWPAGGLSAQARRAVERDAIRWSGDFLSGMGAVESAPRAEQEALMAHRVAGAVAERLQAAVREIRVMVIGGVVHLEGRVGSFDARTEAEQAAREASGAQVIADDLQVG